MGNEFTNKILKLALPITAQQFMLALVSACDAFMLGGLNQNSLSAVSLASQITFVFNLILTELTQILMFKNYKPTQKAKAYV